MKEQRGLQSRSPLRCEPAIRNTGQTAREPAGTEASPCTEPPALPVAVPGGRHAWNGSRRDGGGMAAGWRRATYRRAGLGRGALGGRDSLRRGRPPAGAPFPGVRAALPARWWNLPRAQPAAA